MNIATTMEVQEWALTAYVLHTGHCAQNSRCIWSCTLFSDITTQIFSCSASTCPGPLLFWGVPLIFWSFFLVGLADFLLLLQQTILNGTPVLTFLPHRHALAQLPSVALCCPPPWSPHYSASLRVPRTWFPVHSSGRAAFTPTPTPPWISVPLFRLPPPLQSSFSFWLLCYIYSQQPQVSLETTLCCWLTVSSALILSP